MSESKFPIPIPKSEYFLYFPQCYFSFLNVRELPVPRSKYILYTPPTMLSLFLECFPNSQELCFQPSRQRKLPVLECLRIWCKFPLFSTPLSEAIFPILVPRSKYILCIFLSVVQHHENFFNSLWNAKLLCTSSYWLPWNFIPISPSFFFFSLNLFIWLIFSYSRI